MKVVVEELSGTLSQTFSTKNRLQVKSIRPYIYKHRSPAGTLTIEIEQNSTTIATSTGVTSADIETNTASTSINFYHGYYRFDFTDQFHIEKGNFTVKLTSSGYTFGESAYFGWVKPHENISIPIDYDQTGKGDESNPFGIEIWTRKGKMTRTLDIDDGFTSASEPSTTFTPPTVTGTFASPTAIVAGTGIEISDVDYEVIIIEGSGGAVDITANPQIETPGTEGARLLLIGASDTNTVVIEDGTGLRLNGTFKFYDKSLMSLVYRDGFWHEVSRAE